MDMNKVLIAVDTAVFGDAMVEMVARHVWPENVEFLILHVIDLDVALDISPSLWESVLKNTRAAARRLVESLASRLRRALDTDAVATVVVEGKPKDRILETARDWGADLIVVGSHSRKGLDQFFLGSVSLAVLSQAPCSVMIVRLPVAADTERARQRKQAVRLST